MKKELEKILENEEFVKELMLKETRDEAKKAIEEKGVSVTDEEMEEIYQVYSAIYEKCKKMSKEDLEKISGGGKVLQFIGVEKTRGQQIKEKAINTAWDLAEAMLVEGGKASIKWIKEYFSPSKNEKTASDQVGSQALIPQISQKSGNSSEGLDKTNIAIAGVGIAAAAGLAYTYKDDIRSWIHRKKTK